MSIETATKHLEWLRIALASRGIPTVILEEHLHVILQALAVEFPERSEMRTRFDPFLLGLDAERRVLGNVEMVSNIVEQFDQRFHACPGLRIDSAAQLIASAWADERCGIAGSLKAVRVWFTDAGRFSSDWIATVNELVAKLDQAGKSPC
jgi:hypothetical protein